MHAFDDINTPFDTAVEILMAAMLLFLPLAFGTTEPWSREVWFALVGLLGVCVLAKQVACRDARLAGSWAFVPIVLFVAVVILQAVRLPPGVAARLSPGAAAVRADLLSDLPAARAAPQSVSLYAHASWQQLTWVLAAATVFAVVVQTYRDARRLRRLLLTVTLAGLAVAVIAAWMDLTDAQTIYGLVAVGHKNAGPFQNYSHFSQCMNLSIGAALALILVTAAEWTDGDADPAVFLEEFRRPEAWPVWAALALCLGGPLLVLWSMSRMGMLSMLVAGGGSAAWLGTRASRGRDGRSGSSFLFVGLGVAVFAAVLALGFDQIYDRLATLRHSSESTTARWQLLHDLLPLYRQFPWLGTGLGTHEFVYPMFSHLDLPRIATHAENEYAQLLEETGVVGMAVILAFAASIVAAYVRATWRPRRPAQYAAFGLGFGLIAIGVHSFSDFGQHVPANAVLTAISAALLVNIASAAKTAKSAGRDDFAPVPVGPLRRAGRGVALLAFAGAAGWAVWNGDVLRRARADWFDANVVANRLGENDWQGADDDYRAMLTSATSAATLSPADVTYAHWLNVYRWKTISHTLDPQTHRAQLNAAQVGFAAKIADAFDAARPGCPTFGPSLSVEGQIRSVVLKQPLGDELIRKAVRLTPHDATVAVIAGDLAARNGDWDASLADYRRYVTLGGSRRGVVDAYLASGQPKLAYAMAAGDRATLDYLAGVTQDPAIATQCREESERLLTAQANAPDADGTVWMARGQLDLARNAPDKAATWFQRAVDSEYNRVDWRMTLAKAQAASGQWAEAARQLQICLRLRPQMAEAEQLRTAYAASARAAGQKDVR